MAKQTENTSTTKESAPAQETTNTPSTKPGKKLPGTTSWWRAHRLELSIVLGVLVVGTAVTWGYLISSGKGFFDLFDGTGGGLYGKREEAEPIALRLDGSPIAADQSQVYPIAVMIENLPEVRPQAGLSQASIVYEALVEGFSTRFLVLFDMDKQIPEIGPVRSARPYYLEWLSEYNALYAHAGGSPEALEVIDAYDLPDLNALYGDGSPYFYRDSSRYAPHNLFSSSDLFVLALRDTDLINTPPAYQPWLFKDDEPTTTVTDAAAPHVTVDFSSASYGVDYYYDAATNDYRRFNGGVEHTDANTNEVIRVKNVVVQVIPAILGIEEKGRLRLDVTGTGRAVIALDGQIIEGTWEKPERTSRTVFKDADGKQIEFNVGPTWVEVLPEGQGGITTLSSSTTD